MADGEPYLLEQVHLPAERFPGLLASDLEHGSLYELLVTRYGTPIVRARETHRARAPARRARRSSWASGPARPRSSSRASRTPPTAPPWSSGGATSAATGPATSSIAWSSGPAPTTASGTSSPRSRAVGRRPMTRLEEVVAASVVTGAAARPATGQRRFEGGARMGLRTSRVATSVAALALLVSACGGSTPSASRARRLRGRQPVRGRRDARSRRPARRPRRARSRSAGTAAWAAATRRSRSRWSSRSSRRSTPATRTSTSRSRPCRTPARTTPSSVQISSGNGPDIVGPVGIGGANAFHGQWLDLAPLIAKTNYDLSGFPSRRRRHLQARRGPGRHPVRDLPVGAVLQEEPLRGGRPRSEPPHEYGEKYTMPDGTTRSTGTTTRSARSRRC